jgi:hypothetical protein
VAATLIYFSRTQKSAVTVNSAENLSSDYDAGEKSNEPDESNVSEFLDVNKFLASVDGRPVASLDQFVNDVARYLWESDQTIQSEFSSREDLVVFLKSQNRPQLGQVEQHIKSNMTKNPQQYRNGVPYNDGRYWTSAIGGREGFRIRNRRGHSPA